MKRYALYAGSEIVGVFTGFEDQVAIQGHSFVEMLEGDDTTHYIEGGTPVPKLEWACEPVIDGLSVTLPGVPDGTTGRVNGTGFEASGDTTLEFDQLGTYRIGLSPPPAYLAKTLEVTLDA